MIRRLTLLLALPIAVAAQAPARAVGGVLDLGYVTSSGNTDLTTFSLGEKLTWKAADKLSVLQTLRAVYGKTADSVTANSLNVGVGADYTLFGRVGVAGGVAYERNKFAGIDKRTEESLGLVWRYASANADSLRLDGGVVWTQQRGVDAVEDDFVAARAALWYKRPIGRAFIQQTLEAIPNLDTSDDWRLNSETSLVAPISARIGLKLSYVIRYDNLPQPTFEKSDRIFTAGVQVTY